MNFRSIEAFDEYRKKLWIELLDKNERPNVVAGFIDYFGNGELTLCSDCFTPVSVRPWILEAIEQYNLRVVCICCVDPQTLKGQLVMDLAKIDDSEKK